MKLIIVSGLSGSGKTVALRTLEDAGYYCIDNLPVGLLSALADQLLEHKADYPQNIAIGIDARTGLKELSTLPVIAGTLDKSLIDVSILFLEANDDVLLRRFNETRRRHPLTLNSKPLSLAIDEERKLLDSICTAADTIIDTSHLSLHELRRKILSDVIKIEQTMQIEIKSFGFKHGVAEDADLMFDARCLPNPHWHSDLRPLTGKDRPVQEFLQQQPDTGKMIHQLHHFVTEWIPCYRQEGRSYLTIAVGCTGGRHRSVYIVEQLSEMLNGTIDDEVITRHRELA